MGRITKELIFVFFYYLQKLPGLSLTGDLGENVSLISIISPLFELREVKMYRIYGGLDGVY